MNKIFFMILSSHLEFRPMILYVSNYFYKYLYFVKKIKIKIVNIMLYP